MGLIRKPLSLIVKPTGAACNLDCSYCFFLSKEALWAESAQQMSHEAVVAFLRRYLDSQPDGEVTVGWQGGEPTLRGLEFFREAVRLGESLRRPGQWVRHAMQTNATLIDDEWGEFLAAQGFLVGVSLDGPSDLHDAYRVNKAGRGTYDQVVRGYRTLRRHGVETNILCTVNAVNVREPLRVYRHFRDDLDADFIQFIPIVERVEAGNEAIAEAGWRADGEFVAYRQAGAGVTSRTVDPLGYGQFLVGVFDEWITRDVGRVFVQDFDVTLGALFGQHTLCVRAPECGSQLVVEHTGEVYSCDHFVEPEYLLGNLHDKSLGELASLPAQREFGQAKRATLPTQCQRCPVRWACNGGCPKDRFVTTATGEPGLNYLCPGYFHFFNHVTPAMREMASLLRSGREAAAIMATWDPGA